MNSRIIIGTWPLSGDYGKIDSNQVRDVLEYCYENEIREFDTAPNYGNGFIEKVLGEFSINKKINEDNNTKSSKTEFVRSSFLPIQKTFIKDSYIIAKEAQTLINSGQKIKANNLLSEYMNNSFKKVYNLTEEINKLI